jgi:hypothetical protein
MREFYDLAPRGRGSARIAFTFKVVKKARFWHTTALQHEFSPTTTRRTGVRRSEPAPGTDACSRNGDRGTAQTVS